MKFGKKKPKESPPPKVSKEEVIAKKIAEADKAILVLTTKGRVEVLGLKDVNFSIDAKGMLQGALDLYSARDITRAMAGEFQPVSPTSGSPDEILHLGDLIF